MKKTELNWKHEYPTVPGNYWFAGERYGRNDFAKKAGELPRYELALCKVRKVSNGVVVIADSNFLYESELGDEWFFAPAEVPALPEFKEPGLTQIDIQ